MAGDRVGLVGPNGAGKTSLIDAITGFATSTGHITLGGQLLDSLKVKKPMLTALVLGTGDFFSATWWFFAGFPALISSSARAVPA